MVKPAPITVADYLPGERLSPIKHELIGRRVVAMAGASREHNTVAANLYSIVGAALRGGPCQYFPSDMRVALVEADFVAYPDLSIVFGEPSFLEDERPDTLENPLAVVEILSPSTEAYDRGAEFRAYRMMPSLQTFVLIATSAPIVEIFTRQPDESWRYEAFSGLEATAKLRAPELALPLNEVYERVEFPPTEAPPEPIR